ncbi:hypothetical protein JTE90_007339 [Oedothorax gibbosus]|uniref:DDE-1 domain-containing protein n=1 Tax=Oedothorax gibbosus TaxID=931172 RepID=A0AAV6TRX4_9ARAC|nr:hypothetical protein JTE90_007339 [Oedothorax gibbosus]
MDGCQDSNYGTALGGLISAERKDTLLCLCKKPFEGKRQIRRHQIVVAVGTTVGPIPQGAVDRWIDFRHLLPTQRDIDPAALGPGILQNLKVLYRKNFMRKLINHDGPIQEFQAAYNVKDAITDVSAAWKDVKKETVRRGWRKLFLAASFESSSSYEDFEGFVIKKSPLEDIIKYAQQYNVKSSSGATEIIATENILQDWVCVDDCAPTSEVITEEDLLETHLNTKFRRKFRGGRRSTGIVGRGPKGALTHF